MNDLINFFEAVYFEEVTVTETETHDGYTSERISYSGSQQTIKLPFEETITTTRTVLQPNIAAFAATIVVLAASIVLLKLFGRLIGGLR